MMTRNNFTHSMPNPETITRVVLDNGVTVLVYENASTHSVVVSGVAEGGSIQETPEANGLAALTAGTLMRGTETRDFQTLAATLEDIGADFGISAGTHHINFGGKALAEDLSVLIDVMADALRNPLFPPDQVERLRGEALTWLRYGLQDTRRQAGRAFRETLYRPDHPYHYTPRGTLETLPFLTVEQIRSFHAKHYGPAGMTIAIAGAVDAAEAVELVRAKLGDWTNRDQSAPRRAPSAPQPVEMARTFVPIPGKTQSDVMIGVVGPSRYAEDFQAARIANSILGEFGMMGRIGEEVREKSGMAYYAYSRLDGGHGPGAWSIAAGVNPTNVDRAVQLSIAEVRKMIEVDVTEDELADNKSYFVGRMPLQLETNEGLAGTILSMETYGLGLDYLIRMPGLINALRLSDVRDAIRRYWNPEAAVVAVAGPQIQA
ncbi:MAG: insulinase family protein [Anaerolineae bacterium]|nr:insulinase family protein [Anaerolineae bacterium]